MLTVIIDARTRAAPLPVLLSQLTAGAVEGLVRQVLILAAPDQPGIAEICEDMGAEAHPAFGEAAKAARAEWLLVLSADFRLRDGWIGALSDHLARGKREAAMVGLAGRGVLVERRRALSLEGTDLNRLRRALGLWPRRIG